MFVTGYKPMRVKKVRYYSDPMFMKRVLPAPDQSAYLNVPANPKIDWLHERPKGAQLTLPGNDGSASAGRPPLGSDDEVDREVLDQRPQSESEYT
jgi:type IV secretory pathway TraG/TraD family ATPase VirD4